MKKEERKKKSCEEKAAKGTRDLPIWNSATLRRREEREGKKWPPKGQKIIIKDGAYTLRSIQFPHFVIVPFALSISVSLWINRVVVSVRSSTLRTRILRPQFSLSHRAIILNS